MAVHVGERFGDYQLKRLLSDRGAFANVYEGEHVFEKTQVAIKVWKVQIEVKTFLNDVRAAVLTHPHIVKILDFNLKGNIPYLVMAYAPYGSLQRLPLPFRPVDIVTYVRGIADGLSYAHQRGVVHRDIKPDNILLGPQHEIWVGDFGIATPSYTRQEEPTKQAFAGTYEYAAPEQWRGHDSSASDQYVLGIMVYEWLCGERPFRGNNIALYYQHINDAPPSLCSKYPTISPDVEQVVMKALEKSPEKRFPTIQMFAMALERALISHISATVPTKPITPTLTQPGKFPGNGSVQPVASSPLHPFPSQSSPGITQTRPARPMTPQPVTPTLPAPGNFPGSSTRPVPSSPHPSNMPKYNRRISRRKVLVVGIATGAATIGGGIIWKVLSSSVSPTIYIYKQPTIYIYQQSDSVNSVAWSPNGKRIASGSGNNLGSGDNTVQVWNATNGSDVYIYNEQNSDPVNCVAWSPNDARIASADSGNAVQVWNAADGSDVYIYNGHSDMVWSVAWSPDGKRIASADGKTVQVWNAADGSDVYTYHRGAWPVAWSPNGKLIVSASSGSNDSSIRVWNATDGSDVYAYHGYSNDVSSVAWSPDSRRIASADGKTVQVWNAADGSDVYIYRGHSDTVWSVAWSPDGKFIASGSADNTAQVWTAP